uniref:Uncharacterized protein n=1 Tax=Amphimedon queenslandica TaxID=400682 RepID=A0A1X7TJB4_AMPQE
MATGSESSPEYAALKKMFGALVNNVADNAPVIPPLNDDLFSSNLIPKAVFIAVQNPGPRATPYDRCNDMLTPVLAKVESNPACFYSLIESLEYVELSDIVVKLKDKLQTLMMQQGRGGAVERLVWIARIGSGVRIRSGLPSKTMLQFLIFFFFFYVFFLQFFSSWLFLGQEIAPSRTS